MLIENHINRKSKSRISKFSYTYIMNNTKILTVVQPLYIYQDTSVQTIPCLTRTRRKMSKKIMIHLYPPRRSPSRILKIRRPRKPHSPKQHQQKSQYMHQTPSLAIRKRIMVSSTSPSVLWPSPKIIKKSPWFYTTGQPVHS